MQSIARGGYSEQEILDALRMKNGPRTLKARYDLLDRDNEYQRQLSNVLQCSVGQDYLNDIKRTAKFSILDDGAINYLSDRILPWIQLVMPKTTETYNDIMESLDPFIWYKLDDPSDPARVLINSANPGTQDGLANVQAIMGGAAVLRTGGASLEMNALAGEYATFGSGTVAGTNARTALSFSVWIHPTAASDWDFIIDNTDGSQMDGFSLYRAPNNQLQFVMQLTTGRLYVFTPVDTIWEGQTYHIVVSWETGKELEIYVNGEKQFLTISPGTLPLTSWGLTRVLYQTQLGRWGVSGTSHYFNGRIDDVAIIRSKVSADDVSRLYAAGLQQGKYTTADEAIIEWPQGVFLLSTPIRTSDEHKRVIRDVEAYDQLQVYADDKVVDRFTVTVGDLYTTAISGILGNIRKSITPSAKTLPVSMDWEPSTPKLSIINDLLNAINYESLWFDELGTAIVRPYVAPSDRAPEFVYRDDEDSVTLPVVSQEIDLFNIPNRIVLVVSDADRPALRAQITNNDPSSPTSVPARGRIISEYATEEDAADFDTLAEKSKRRLKEASQIFESVNFDTAIMPFHSSNDVYTFAFDNLVIDEKYSEQSWEYTLNFGAGETMKHTIRRVVDLSV